MDKLIKSKLVLANNQEFYGYSPSWQTHTTFGEVVFNTGMTGYEETLTDPSYSGQILTFTFPILGNYGVGNGESFESNTIHVKGVICQTVYDKPPAHYSSNKTFLEWLYEHKIPIIWGIDTRELTKVIRNHGVIQGAIMNINSPSPTDFEDFTTIDWVSKVSPKVITTYGVGRYKIILVDCGSKSNILNNLLKFDTTVTVVPYDYDYTELDYDGVFLSNGPGDPKLCVKTISVLKKVLSDVKPVYGICLGSQLMSLAVGANTYKLKFGHRGQNQPCINIETNKCYLTSQNHGYAVDDTTLPNDWIVSYRNLNDNTVAGIKHKNKPFSAVQFHPEASPGPEDTFFFFEEFISLLSQGLTK